MKNIITFALLTVAVIGLNAQTNVVNTNTVSTSTLSITNTVSEEGGKTAGGIEVTLGGSGSTVDSQSEGGFDFSISTNPFEKCPSLWVGVAQSLYFDPEFSGSTDLFADWSTDIWNETLYLNTGWFVGVMYDETDTMYRTGPEVALQYYTSDNAFIYLGVNYDIVSVGENGLRYSFGVGLAF